MEGKRRIGIIGHVGVGRTIFIFDPIPLPELPNVNALPEESFKNTNSKDVIVIDDLSKYIKESPTTDNLPEIKNKHPFDKYIGGNKKKYAPKKKI